MFLTQLNKLKLKTILNLFLFPLLAASFACPPQSEPCNVVVSVLALDTAACSSFAEVVWQTTSYDTTLLEELNGYAHWKKAPDFFCDAGTITEVVCSDSSKLKFEASVASGKPFARYFGRREDETRYIPSGAALDRLREWHESIKLKEGWMLFP